MREEKKNDKKQKKRQKEKWIVKIMMLENPGIDPGTSRMQSGRSTI